MTRLLLLLLLLISQSSQDGAQEGVLDCEPQNLTLSGSGQTLWVTWDEDPSCSAAAAPLSYRLTLFREEQQVEEANVSAGPDRVGSGQSWEWKSKLPVDCASHSVRIRSWLNDRLSSWERRRTRPGRNSSKNEEIFPQDAVLAVGSEATFCCLLPEGNRVENMSLRNYNSSNLRTTRISDQRFSLTLRLETVGNHVDVKCRDSDGGDYGASVYIGYPPDDRDLRCETRDLESAECSWKKGRDTNLQLKSSTKYQFNGSLYERPCKDGICSLKKKLKVDSGEKIWTLTAENKLGNVELRDSADLMTRIYLLAPEGLSASQVNSRNISLRWNWTLQRYRDLNLTCQVKVQHGDRTSTTEHFGLGLSSAVLMGLIPNWEYDVKVRCGTAQHFWKWGDWSRDETFRTKGDVPDVLDVWMQKKENQVVILWKELLDTQRHGDISGYQVSWKTGADMNQTSDVHNVSLSLDTGRQHAVNVSAWNQYGRSAPSAIIVPGLGPGETAVKTSQVTGRDRVLNLSWSGSPAASCGYVVDWSPAVRLGPVDWLKVPPNETTASLPNNTLEGGVRYSVSIFACTDGAPVLLEKRDAYIRETQIEDGLFRGMTSRQQDSDAVVSWLPVPLREQSAFITGYVLEYRSDSGKVFTVSTDDPEATTLTAKHLEVGTYSFTLAALTAVGRGGNTTISATLNPPTPTLIFVSLGVVFVSLLLVLFLCYRYWACIKQKVYPPIPKPVMSNLLFSSPVKSCAGFVHPELSDPSLEVMDVLQLHLKAGTPESGYVNQEDVSLTCPQTHNGYYNETRDQLGGLNVSCGYKPQSSVETSGQNQDQDQDQDQDKDQNQDQNKDRQDLGIVCISDYILAPQLSSF
ncbi:oncostatin-M-specific receptor subunit beta isoform X2 [Kryptolebias marmoratus]|uniref:oncostatin-M-specific receptor subunit beta isoform X2 n=1 Tax=Kryptolebias marmoratus TaxID=37003 RepID=UPI000D52FEF1|nr:oncostatin-M-specific receptor subunit beta isoform X2 [Kryptolebias marmoratus]